MTLRRKIRSLSLTIAGLLAWATLAMPANGGDAPLRTTVAPSGPKVAIFDESIEWATSREATDRIVAQLVALGVDTYIPCVWHGRGTYYATSVAKPDVRVAARISAGDDPLRYLLQVADRHGIKVQVWFTVVKREDSQYPDFFGTGTPKGAYDIHVPAFRRFIVDLILEVGDKYAIDGVNLDYIRSMGLCTSDACVESYRAFAQSDLLSDSRMRSIPAKRERLSRWNEAALKDIVTQIRAGLGDTVELSVDGHSLNRHTELQGQFTVEWSNTGLIDRIYDIRYASTIAFAEIDKVRDKLTRPESYSILLSNAAEIDGKWTPRTGAEVEAQIEAALQRWPDMQLGLWHRPRITPDQQFVLEAILKR